MELLIETQRAQKTFEKYSRLMNVFFAFKKQFNPNASSVL